MNNILLDGTPGWYHRPDGIWIIGGMFIPNYIEILKAFVFNHMYSYNMYSYIKTIMYTSGSEVVILIIKCILPVV